jgi:hypothetical protein
VTDPAPGVVSLAANQQAPAPDTASMRDTIARRLAQDVAPIANLYEAGLAILSGNLLDEHKYIIAHVMREIRTRLPLHYGVASVGRFDYVAEIKKFSDDWNSEISSQLQTVGDLVVAPGQVVISQHIASAVSAFIEGHEAVRDKVRDLYVGLNERVNPTTYPQTATNAIIDQWLDLPLPGMAHMPGPNAHSYTLAECLEAWTIMEKYLFYIFAPAHITYAELDAIIEDANAG